MAAMDLQIGVCVHYGAHGVCRVCGRETKDFGGHQRVYYTLEPLGREGLRLYLPEDAEPERVKLRPLMSRQEILELIRSSRELPWIADSRTRREAFNQVLRDGEAAELMGMLKTVHLHQTAQGKRLSMSDEELAQAARRQLYGEMAYVLAMDEGQVRELILAQIQEIN